MALENNKPKALILSGDGINCETETIAAFKLAGADPEKIHVNALLENPKILSGFKIFCIPGGFSFGDDLGSGRVLALKLKHGLSGELENFKNNGGLILGICNGFQVLLKLGLLNSKGSAEIQQDLSLTKNTPQGFINTWVGLKVDPKSPCVWTKGIEKMELPIRHGEGRLVLSDLDDGEISEFVKSGRIALSYENEINGSFRFAAGICDDSGRVFGLMPHPEAYQVRELGRNWTRGEKELPLGQKIFENGVQAAIESN